MKTTIHCDERITNIRHTIYVKLFWGGRLASQSALGTATF